MQVHVKTKQTTQLHPNLQATQSRTLHLQLTLVYRNQITHNGQAQPRTSRTLIATHPSTQYMIKLLGGDARPVISTNELPLQSPLGRLNGTGAHLYFPLRPFTSIIK